MSDMLTATLAPTHADIVGSASKGERLIDHHYISLLSYTKILSGRASSVCGNPTPNTPCKVTI